MDRGKKEEQNEWNISNFELRGEIAEWSSCSLVAVQGKTSGHQRYMRQTEKGTKFSAWITPCVQLLKPRRQEMIEVHMVPPGGEAGDDVESG